MRASVVRRSLGGALALAACIGAVGCETDNNPYGLPYRSVFSTIVGAYRPAELLTRPAPFLDGRFQPPPDGSDIRFAIGSRRTMTGRLFIPGGGPGGADLDERLAGNWTYDVPAQQLIVDFEPDVAASPSRVVFQITFLADRIILRGDANVAGVPLALELAKPLPPKQAPAGGGGPSFNIGRR